MSGRVFRPTVESAVDDVPSPERIALERLCPWCSSRSYGGGSSPRVRDGLVYRRRLCLGEGCQREFVVVEGVLSENPRLAEALEGYHAEGGEDLSDVR